MPEIKTYIIFALLAIVVFSYMKPDMFHDYTTKGVDSVKSIIPVNFGQGNTAKDLPIECPNTLDAVCGTNNITYINPCVALKANQTYTAGACR